MQKQPLILTLRLDEQSQAFFNTQRQSYFPPERNVVDAHLLLFHQLPNKPTTFDFLDRFNYNSFSFNISSLMNLGSGVAYRAESPQLTTLHRSIAGHFWQELIPQDHQSFRPHITITNKITPEQVRLLLATFMEDFGSFNVQAKGLDLWTYLGGPWRHEKVYLFR